MKNQTIAQFIEETSSSAPTPGGGSVAALVAALSSALTSMVASLSVNKKGLEAHSDKMNSIIAIMKEKNIQLLSAMDEDVRIFNELMATYRLPKNNDEEKRQRTAMIQTKTKEAILIPLDLADKTFGLFADIHFCLINGNQNVSSDALIAGLLAKVAIMSAICNIEINLSSLKDEEYKSEMSLKIKELIAKTNEWEKRIIDDSTYLK